MRVSHLSEVVIDARWLRTGIGRYTLTLLQHLKPNLPETLLTCITMPAYVESVTPFCDRVVEMNCGIYSLAEQARLPFVSRHASVFCAPHYNIPVFRTGPLIVTIHDLTHLIFPAYRSRLHVRLYAELMIRLACARAAHIVTPSQYTRQMLIDRLGADPNKIAVIPCAIGEHFRPGDKREATSEVRASFGISTPYLLFVGSASPHKNLMTLLAAYLRLRDLCRDALSLVLVLPNNPKASAASRLLPLTTTPGVHCLHGVADHSLASLYSAAIMTVMPSFEEGFGLPVIESMACGTPVICSNTASLPEIAGDSALYFSPNSAEEMAAAMAQVIDSRALQQRLTTSGLERAARYSSSRAAAAYASVLSSVACSESSGAYCNEA